MAAPGYAPKGGGSFSGGGGGYKVVNGMIVQPSAPPAPTGGGGGGKPSSHGSFLGQLAKGLSAPVWGGEALGIVPHSVAHAVYGLNAGLLGVAVHPILTAKQFGVPLKGLVEAPYAVAKDFEHQIGKGQIPLPLQALTDPVGTTLGLGYIGARHPVATQQAAVSKAKAVERVGGHLVKAQIQDIKNLYGPHWEYYANHEPLNNFLNVTSLAGGVTRGVALEAAAARLAAEGDIASSRLAVALKEPGTRWKESGNFGILRTSYTTPEGTTMHFDQPYSHSPLMAYTQMTLQGISERYPNMRVFGAMPRVTRATANQIRRNVDRFLTSVPGMESVGALNKGERQRLYWGGQLGDYSATGLQRVRDMLTDTWAKPFQSGDLEFDALMNRAKQEGFGPSLIKNIDLGIKEAQKNPEILEGSKFDQAITAMRHMNDVNEEALLNSAGFAHINNDIRQLRDNLQRIRANTPMMRNADPETARLHLDALQKARGDLQDAMEKRNKMMADHKRIFGGRLNLLKDAVDFHHASKLQTPIGNEWLSFLTKQFKSKEQAEEAVRLGNILATRFSPDDPAAWWRDAAGRPSAETAGAFMQRVEPGQALTQYERLPFGGAKAKLYYSPLSRAVEEMPSKTMQVGQLLKYLGGRGVSTQEIEHAGIEDFLHSLSNSDVVHQDELQQVLNGPTNGFNLEMHHWTNGKEGEIPPFLEWNQGAINARDPATGDYHHFMVSLPEGVGERYGKILMDDKPGRGFLHSQAYDLTTGNPVSGRINNIAHWRGQIIHHLDGSKTLLVEEMQSDWAKDFKAEVKRHGDVPKGNERAKIAARGAEAQKAREDILKEFQDERAIRDEVRSTMGLEITSEERDRLRAANAKVDVLRDKLIAATHRVDDINAELRGTRLMSSPLGPRRFATTLSNHINQFAHEQGVDRVVLSDMPTQAARNATYSDDLPSFSMSNEVFQQTMRRPPHANSAFSRLYEDEFPKALAKATGEMGHYDKAAYEGQFRNAYDQYAHTNWGPMGGTVFDLGENSARRAGEMKALYQTAENERLPRGALEFLKDGRRVIRIFRDGDLSTFIHELSHTAFHDLPEEDQAVLSRHYADGAPVHKWSVDAHEAYAQDFERYMAIGKAPTRALEPVFEKIARWMGALWQTVKGEIPDIHPEVREIFDNMFRGQGQPDFYVPHRTQGADILGIGGTRGVPRANREIGDRVMRAATSMKRNKLALLFSGTLNPDPRLLVEQTHRVAMLERANHLRDKVWEISQPREPGLPPDIGPNGTQYVVRRAGMGADSSFYDAIENAENPQQLHDTYSNFIDNHITGKPDVLANWEAALANDPNGRHAIRLVNKRTVDSLFKDVTGKIPGATTKPQTTATKILDATLDTVRGMLLYANPGFYVANMLGNAGMMMMADPRAGRYMYWSMKQAFRRGYKADPLWHRVAVEMGRGPMSGSLSERTPLLDTPLRDRAASVADALRSPRERAAAAKEAITRPGAVGRGAKHVSHVWGMTGRATGRVIDDTFRVAAWRQEASKLGYDTYAKQEKLLNDAVRDSKKDLTTAHSKALRDLNSIRDSAEQLMLDFDSMTPFEKDKLTRAIFLYPFMKAATKYPFQFLGRRPITAGIVGNLGFAAENYANQQLGPPDPNLPAWMQDYARTPWGYLPVSSLSSFQPLSGIAASVGGLGGQGQLGVNRPIEYTNPLLQMAIDMARQQSKFGKSQPMWTTFKSEVPIPAYIKQGIFGHPPGKIYANRDFMHTLERAFRGPFQINPSVAAQEKARGTRP